MTFLQMVRDQRGRFGRFEIYQVRGGFSRMAASPDGIEPVTGECVGRHAGARLGEENTQAAPRACDPTFHRADIDAEGGGNLIVRAVHCGAPVKNFALGRIELFHALGYETGKLPHGRLAGRAGFLAGKNISERC